MVTTLTRSKVLIVGEEGLFRDLLTRALANEPSLEVVGTATDADSALNLLRGLSPDVVVSNIRLPGGASAIELGRRIKQEKPETGIVMLGSLKDRQYLANIPPAESSGWCYLLRESIASVSVLVRAIESSALGLVVIDPKLIASRWPQEGSRLAKLSPQQRAVLELLAQGYNNHAIAQKLAPLGQKSIANYINLIYKELGLHRSGPWHPRVKSVLIFQEEGQPAATAA